MAKTWGPRGLHALLSAAALSLAAIVPTAVALGSGDASSDRASGTPTTELISRADGANGKGGDDNSMGPAISADGRYVAFTSDADNLSTLDNDKVSNVFVRDRQTGKVILASRADGPAGATANGGSDSADISADGRYVLFDSYSTNLGVPAPRRTEIYLRDLVAGTTTLVSRADGLTGAPAGDYVQSASLSADGRHVSFEASAPNLTAENPAGGIYVRDIDTGVTEFVSRGNGPAGVVPTEGAFDNAISADGRYVAFTSRDPLGFADGDDAGDIVVDAFIRDRVAQTTALLTVGNGTPGTPLDCDADYIDISDSGQVTSFNCGDKVTIRNVATGTTKFVSKYTRNGPQNAPPALSSGGDYVAYVSDSKQNSPLQRQGGPDIFAANIASGLTVNVSRGTGFGVLGDSLSEDPAISANGRYVAFASRATNFSTADDDKANDIFLRKPAYVPDKALPLCDDRNPTQIGTEGKDVLTGTARPDVIVGLGGADIIKGGASGDVLCGGTGDDHVYSGKTGDVYDKIFGGPGNDFLKLNDGGSTAFGRGGNDVLIGSATNDSGDTLKGEGGNDILKGLSNADYNPDDLEGGNGNDRLYGGPNIDFLFGGKGNDELHGGTGDDKLKGGPGRNLIDYGPGGVYARLAF